ncbi:MAG TPA: hypothetical protein VFZ09_27125 [Archangium sp.]|uniref:hypothetical protein n=1 Tax=Archangium sp. TaxID=1872627 RepID=UPI002E3523BB|nr:hypothetical protein [Archangium sp.]HEX5749933.1 hypothetical protein [Archangium sp.]
MRRTRRPSAPTRLGTYTPSRNGLNTFAVTYTLPEGRVQAVRANFRFVDSSNTNSAPFICSSGNYDDHAARTGFPLLVSTEAFRAKFSQYCPGGRFFMFLTQLDPRAEIKGSRDPLGLQAIWSHFGREVVGNLTTVTQSLRDFRTLLFGFHFVEQAIAMGKRREEERCAMFLQFEQLAAYSLYASGVIEDGGAPMRGINRVRARLDASDRVHISAEREHQILGNQKIYGLWGLYSSAARESGWTEPAEQRLNDTTAQLAERIWWHVLKSQARRMAEEVLHFLGRNAPFEPRGRHAPLARALSRVLTQPLEGEFQRFFEDTLVCNRFGPSSERGLQEQLWSLIEQANGRSSRAWIRGFDFTELRKLLELSTQDSALHMSLHHIERVELVLAAVGSLFQYLLAKNGQRTDNVAKDVRQRWGSRLAHLLPSNLREIEGFLAEAVGQESAGRVVAMQATLASGEYKEFFVVAAEHNAQVMKDRGGAPWLSVEGNRLRVRIKSEVSWLPEPDELPELWVNSYFLNSLKRVGAQVTGRAA